MPERRHDLSEPRIPEGLSGYPSFQDHLMQRAKEYGLNWNQDPSGAYAVYTGPLTIIGLSAATHWRKLTFQKERQLTFLEQQLSDRTKNELGIIMCHVPLLAHNPQRKPKTAHPYLAKDKTLQKILDAQEKFIYLSGHTHLSPNIPDLFSVLFFIFLKKAFFQPFEFFLICHGSLSLFPFN